MDGQESCIRTNFTDLSGDNLKLLLERSGLGPHLELLHDLTESRILADHQGHHLASASSYVSTREHNARGQEMALSLVDLLQIDETSLVAAFEADVEGLFPTLVRLSRHGCLVGLKLAGVDDEAVDGDDKTVVQVDDVTDVQEVDMDLLVVGLSILSALASHSYLI